MRRRFGFMRIRLFACRTIRVVAAFGLLSALPGWTASGRAQDLLLPRTLALAFGVNGTPTPVPGGPRPYEYPADHPLVSITLPAKWNGTYEKGSGKLLCVPTDAQAGYSAVFGRGGDFATVEQARFYLDAQVRETLANAKMTAVKIHPVTNGKLSSGLDCQIQVVDGKIGAVPTSFIFFFLAPVEGKYFMLVARGRSDKLLGDAGAKVVGDIADSINAL